MRDSGSRGGHLKCTTGEDLRIAHGILAKIEKRWFVKCLGCRDEKYLLLNLTTNDIGEYLIMLVTVRAKPSVGGDAVLIEDTKGTEGLVLRIVIARV